MIWMDSAPVTIMTTIHFIGGERSEEFKTRWHSGDKSTNAAATNQEFQGVRQQEMLIPIIFRDYNKHKVGLDMADQYRTYYNIQLTS